jgi:hypothetical protein
VLLAVVGEGSEIAVLKAHVMKVQSLLEPASTSQALESVDPETDPVN